MEELELDRTQLEKIRVAAARAEMEFNVKQRKVEIARLEANIAIQLTREQELNNKIEELQRSK